MEAERTEQQRVDDFEAVQAGLGHTDDCPHWNEGPCMCPSAPGATALARIQARLAEAERERDALEQRLARVDTGCFNCGGLPHTDTCRVRDVRALLGRAERAEAELQTWRAASGLDVDGSTDAVTPEHLLEEFKARELALAEEAKKRAAALADVARLRAEVAKAEECTDALEEQSEEHEHIIATARARERERVGDVLGRLHQEGKLGVSELRHVQEALAAESQPIEPTDRCAECDHHRVHHDASLPEGEQCGALADLNCADCDCAGFTEREP